MVPAYWNDVCTRLGVLRQQYPEWQAVFLVWQEILRALEDPVWGAVELLPAATLQVDARQVCRWLARLLRSARKHRLPEAAGWRPVRLGQEGTLALLEAALCQDQTRLAALATVHMGPAGYTSALVSLAHLAVVPLLQACGRRLSSHVPPTWSKGYCPICGAWPSLAEVRGLEHSRRLRCARCGGDWPAVWLCCPYCGEARHQRLGVLRPAAPDAAGTVDTCTTCQGYIKTRTTLQAFPTYAVALEELTMVTFDLAALERGLRRPGSPGYALACHLTARPRRARLGFGWRG